MQIILGVQCDVKVIFELSDVFSEHHGGAKKQEQSEARAVWDSTTDICRRLSRYISPQSLTESVAGAAFSHKAEVFTTNARQEEGQRATNARQEGQ